jgi:hypothetical protein
MSPFQLGWRETRAGKEPPGKTSGKVALREWSGPESSEDTGALFCALASALKCGSRGLLFRSVKRTHSEKGVMGEVIAWPVNSRDIEKDGETGKTLSVVGIRKSRVGWFNLGAV